MFRPGRRHALVLGLVVAVATWSLTGAGQTGSKNGEWRPPSIRTHAPSRPTRSRGRRTSIGSAPTSHFMSGAARAGRGTFTYIGSTVPKELYEAAEMDGAKGIATFFFVVVPIIRPGLAALGVWTLISTWNDFQVPLVVLG